MAREWGRGWSAFCLSLPPTRTPEPELFSPCSLGQLGPPPRPAAERHLLLLGRNFSQWRRPTQQGEATACSRGGGGLRMTDPVASDPLGVSEGWRGISPKTFILSLDPIAAKAMQRFEPGGDGSMGRNAPRQRFLLLEVVDKKVGVGPGAGW